jgi:hypothetical protein
VTYWQTNTIRGLLKKKGYAESDLLKKYKVGNIAYLASTQVDQIITNLKKLPDFETEDEGDQIAKDAARYLS